MKNKYIVYRQSLDKQAISFIAVCSHFGDAKQELFKVLSERIFEDLETGRLNIPEFDYLSENHIFTESELYIAHNLSEKSINHLLASYPVEVRTFSEHIVRDCFRSERLIIAPSEHLVLII